MKSLSDGIKDYVLMKKAMGFSFYDQELRLRSFCKFMEKNNKVKIALDLSKRWALDGEKSPTWRNAKNLSTLRAFATYWKTIDTKTELWPHNYWPIRYQRKNPYIYRDSEVQKLLRACHTLEPKMNTRSLTFYTLFGLIAACGLRVSEALSLTIDDVDIKAGIITIRVTKFNKTRAIPVHETTRRALKKYAAVRDSYSKQIGVEIHGTGPFFITPKGGVISGGIVEWTFNKIALKCGVRKESRRGPRIHDLRHTFVVRTLESWYSQKKMSKHCCRCCRLMWDMLSLEVLFGI